MKILNKLTDSGMINEATDKKFVTNSEKTLITHSNRAVIDKFTEVSGALNYNGSPVGGKSAMTWGDLMGQ